ncbi:MAG: hypothetical protein ACI33N_00375 [Desulfovibrionaceae bacterium]|nr:hypothetical protein [Desulfovibrionaceae bacterium]
MAVTADQLRCKYVWTEYPAGDPRLTGEADDVRFNRAEGHEMLAFITAYLKRHGLEETPDNAVRVECLIRESLPSFCMFRKTVDMWISQHWDD